MLGQEERVMKCHKCLQSRESDRLPPGWKRHRDAVWCKACWRAAYILRAITVPVAGPLDADWRELRDCLQMCWADSTALANWVVTELAKRDVIRAGEARMPKFEFVYLYPDARKRFPHLNCQSVVSILQAVDRRYRRRRLEAIWRSSESLPRYRYPMPYPTHNQGWKVIKRGNDYTLRVRMQGEPWDLRLRGGNGFGRQQRQMDQILDGSAVQGELAIYRVRAHAGDHRNGAAGKASGEKAFYRIMTKMVAWLPREERRKGKGIVLSLRTASDRFWIASSPAIEDIWHLNADQARTWIIGYERFRQRLSEDRRPETPRHRANRDLELRGKKHRDRIRSFVQMSVAGLAGYARRRGVGTIIYHDTDRSYFPSFPWAAVVTALQTKLDEYGIAFEHASAEVASESPDPLAKEEHE